MSRLEIPLKIYRGLLTSMSKGVLPIKLKARSVIGTVQDDPFDVWIGQKLTKILPKYYQIYHSGSLTTPDIIIRNKKTGSILGLEVKKLIQLSNGRDSRGLTIDYNSSLPCGSTMIKIEDETIIIPCFYLFALLDNKSKNILTLILMDGDFLNYDFDLYKESKYANTSEYNHGPYGEGSVRHRKMYTYPNPLNSKLSFFYHRQLMIGKKSDFEQISATDYITEKVIRDDEYGNSFYYYLKDETIKKKSTPEMNSLPILKDIFLACKMRKPKQRTVAIPNIPKL